MEYTSTRNGALACRAAAAISGGLAPDGGLYLPRTVPRLDLQRALQGTYTDTAAYILETLLPDLPPAALRAAIAEAYSPARFPHPEVTPLHSLDPSLHVLELWHGPTAAFKDVALQLMPSLMSLAQQAGGEHHHTLILVATSGDTGKAALEGFRDRAGIDIAVFYPADGVSAVQERQMVTTTGRNTHVVAVEGNFDDCQAGVKRIFGAPAIQAAAAARGCRLSSANSINWGRLCPQIVYYFRAAAALTRAGALRPGAPFDVAVPTGNFGNILAADYARRMGLPIRRLICASNRNRVLYDFFTSGTYDVRRDFHRTTSPSMDILVSSNLERFLFDVNGQADGETRAWFEQLRDQGLFAVDADIRAALAVRVTAGWADDEVAAAAIRQVFDTHGYVLDTHTATAMAVAAPLREAGIPLVVAATANPYKFSGDVLRAIRGSAPDNEFDAVRQLHALSGMPLHRAVAGLETQPVRHNLRIPVAAMAGTVSDLLARGPAAERSSL